MQELPYTVVGATWVGKKPRRQPLRGSKLTRKARGGVYNVKDTPTKKKKPTKPKKTKIDLRREWLIPDTTGKLRYVGIRGCYWYWLSRDIRKSEWEKYGVCITCLEPIEDWTKADCGHIIASDGCGEYLRLNRMNLTLQHKKCNNSLWTPQAGVLNTLNMDKRHGAGYMENLRQLINKECKEPTVNEYKDLIRALPSYQEALTKSLTIS